MKTTEIKVVGYESNVTPTGLNATKVTAEVSENVTAIVDITTGFCNYYSVAIFEGHDKMASIYSDEERTVYEARKASENKSTTNNGGLGMCTTSFTSVTTYRKIKEYKSVSKAYIAALAENGLTYEGIIEISNAMIEKMIEIREENAVIEEITVSADAMEVAVQAEIDAASEIATIDDVGNQLKAAEYELNEEVEPKIGKCNENIAMIQYFNLKAKEGGEVDSDEVKERYGTIEDNQKALIKLHDRRGELNTIIAELEFEIGCDDENELAEDLPPVEVKTPEPVFALQTFNDVPIDDEFTFIPFKVGATYALKNGTRYTVIETATKLNDWGNLEKTVTLKRGNNDPFLASVSTFPLHNGGKAQVAYVFQNGIEPFSNTFLTLSAKDVVDDVDEDCDAQIDWLKNEIANLETQKAKLERKIETARNKILEHGNTIIAWAYAQIKPFMNSDEHKFLIKYKKHTHGYTGTFYTDSDIYFDATENGSFIISHYLTKLARYFTAKQFKAAVTGLVDAIKRGDKEYIFPDK